MSRLPHGRYPLVVFFAGLLASIICSSLFADESPEPAGQVIVARGLVHALAPDGGQRSLRRRSPVYTGEVIRTAPASEVQLRLTDGALLALRADTEFRIDDYRFQNQGGSGDRSVSTLIKGGLRTITGVIGKQVPEAYQVTTPVATIGVRGTHYEAVLESPGSLVLAAWQGAIQVRNAFGSIELGTGAAHNFGRAEAQQRPRGLLQAPGALQTGAAVGLSETPEAPEAPATQTDGAPPADAEETPAGTEPAAGTADPAGPTGASASAGSGNGPIGNQVDAPCSTCTPPQQALVEEPLPEEPLPEEPLPEEPLPEEPLPEEPLPEEPLPEEPLPEEPLPEEPLPEEPLPEEPLPEEPLPTDLRFSTIEWEALQTTPYLGIAVEAETTSFFGVDGGPVLNHGSNSPIFTDKGYGPHEPEYETAPVLDVVRRGGASVDAFGAYSLDAAHTLYWGTWNGTVNPVELQLDPADPAAIEPMYSPYHWATLLPTDQTVMAARTGTFSYNNVVVAHGGGSGGGPLTPASLIFNADINFDSGAVNNGSMYIYNGPEMWDIHFGGQVRGNVLDLSIDTGMSTVMTSPDPARAVEGDMGMAFTGNSGQAIGGGFVFQEIGNPARHVEGILLVE